MSKVDVSGFQKGILSHFSKKSAAVTKVSSDIMEEVKVVADMLVPVDTGALLSSGRVVQEANTTSIIYGDQTTGRYGRATADYAADVHEGISVRPMSGPNGVRTDGTRILIEYQADVPSEYLQRGLDAVMGSSPEARLSEVSQRLKQHV